MRTEAPVEDRLDLPQERPWMHRRCPQGTLQDVSRNARGTSSRRAAGCPLGRKIQEHPLDVPLDVNRKVFRMYAGCPMEGPWRPPGCTLEGPWRAPGEPSGRPLEDPWRAARYPLRYPSGRFETFSFSDFFFRFRCFLRKYLNI